MHCKRLDILPIRYRFDYHDLKSLHSIVYHYSCVCLPAYLQFFSGNSRLRNTHLDELSLVSSITPKRNVGLSKSFFYRAHLEWNRLPLSLREISRPSNFKSELLRYLWKEIAASSVSVEDGLEPDL